MNLLNLSFQNIKSKPLYTFLSVFILSISIALLLGIQQLKSSFKNQIENNLGKIDVVLGAKGSPLQLVLASVLHIDNPTGNISYSEAKKIAKSPMIKAAVPISYGDNYKGFRIVGTTKDYYPLYNAELESGRDVEVSMEVVLGNSVAKQLNLKIGDTFLSSHGLIENNVDIHTDELTVVGILKPTQKVIDRLIVTNLESIWDVHADHNHSEEDHKNIKEGEEHHEHSEDEHDDHDHEHSEDEHDDHDHGHSEDEHNDHDHEHSEDDHDDHDHEHSEDEHDDHDHEHSEDEHDDHDHGHSEDDHDDHDHEHSEDEHDNHDHGHSEDEHDAHDHEHLGEEHDDHHNAHDHDDSNKEITSLLINFKSPRALLTFPRKINEDTNFQAVLPKYELHKLYEYTSVGFKTISWIAYLILIISCITIFISLYKMVKERAFDLAILRTYGASNFQLIKMVLYEGLFITFIAFILGFVFIKIGLGLLFNFTEINYHQNLVQTLLFKDVLQIGILIFIMVIISVFLAIYPIVKMNISTILSNEK